MYNGDFQEKWLPQLCNCRRREDEMQHKRRHLDVTRVFLDRNNPLDNFNNDELWLQYILTRECIRIRIFYFQKWKIKINVKR